MQPVFGAAVGKRDQETLFLIINSILCNYTLALLVTSQTSTVGSKAHKKKMTLFQGHFLNHLLNCMNSKLNLSFLIYSTQPLKPDCTPIRVSYAYHKKPSQKHLLYKHSQCRITCQEIGGSQPKDMKYFCQQQKYKRVIKVCHSSF